MSGIEAVGLALDATGLSYKVIAAAIDYSRKVKTAKQHTEKIRHEVSEIIELLNSVHSRASACKKADGSVHQWISLEDVDGSTSSLQQIRQDLEAILEHLSSPKLSKLEQFTWPKKLKKIEKLMQSVAKERGIIVEKMQIDSGFVVFPSKFALKYSEKLYRFQSIETDRKVAQLIKISESMYNSCYDRSLHSLAQVNSVTYRQITPTSSQMAI